MAFSANDRDMLGRLKILLEENFKVKLLGELHTFIDWEISITANGIYLGQERYVNRVLRSHNLTHVSSVITHLPTTCDISAIQAGEKPLSAQDHQRYRSIVGATLFLAVCTRPDISFYIMVLARQLRATMRATFKVGKATNAIFFWNS